MNLLEIRGYDAAQLKRLYECRHVDVVLLSTQCHRRPDEHDLDITPARIEAFDTDRMQRTMRSCVLNVGITSVWCATMSVRVRS